jgi:hypothetical protein
LLEHDLKWNRLEGSCQINVSRAVHRFTKPNRSISLFDAIPDGSRFTLFRIALRPVRLKEHAALQARQ